jgi:hypothetical protein
MQSVGSKIVSVRFPQDAIQEILWGFINRWIHSADRARAPETIRLVEVTRAHPPLSVRHARLYLARRNDSTGAPDVLARKLEDLACAHASKLSSALPGFDAASDGRDPNQASPLN